RVLRRDVLRRVAALPGRSRVDREEDMDAVLLRVANGAVVEIPMVRGIIRVAWVRGALLRDAVGAAPVDVLADLLNSQLAEEGERLRDRPVERLRLVVDANPQVARPLGRSCCRRDERRR